MSSTQDLAGELTRIVSNTTDYRARVDAISDLLRGREDGAAKTALVMALASVAEQPLPHRR